MKKNDFFATEVVIGDNEPLRAATLGVSPHPHTGAFRGGYAGWLPTGSTRGYRPCGNTPPFGGVSSSAPMARWIYKFHLAFRQMKHSFMRRQAPISSSAGTSIFSHGVKPVGIPACATIHGTPPNGGVDSRQRMPTNRARWHQSLHTNPCHAVARRAEAERPLPNSYGTHVGCHAPPPKKRPAETAGRGGKSRVSGTHQ